MISSLNGGGTVLVPVIDRSGSLSDDILEEMKTEVDNIVDKHYNRLIFKKDT